MLSVAEALARVTHGLEPLKAESVPLDQAAGRLLAEDLAARLTQPPFDASAMDGFAARASDLVSLPARLRLIGEAAAGHSFVGAIGPGETVRIFTGAPVPDGADTIVLQENADVADGAVTVREAPRGDYIRRRGKDFHEGEVLLEAGRKLGPRELTLVAGMNYAQVPVRRRPKVAILSTGDEVIPPGSELAPGQIVASVGFGLAALIESEGGEAMRLGIAKDEVESLLTLIRAGSAAEILVTVGGASVGARDLVGLALSYEGFELDYKKLAMRPGKPVFYGQLGNQRVLGLPGNPVSALICAEVFLVPMLRGLLGRKLPQRAEPEATLASDLEANGLREHYMRAVSEWTPEGERRVTPLPSQDSSLMAALARADCLIVRPPHAPALRAGAKLHILPLGD
jgi:molybdopterin molybdotransferase